jgi:hypothetical protein
MKKIDSYFEDERELTDCKMKPIYGLDESLNCGTIIYGDKTYFIDYKDKDKIINSNKNFVFINVDKEDYPSYTCNYKRFTYLDFIFNYNAESVFYNFKNNNKFDLRRCNVEIYHNYHRHILENYNFIEYIKGHYLTVGQDANIMKNPLWRIIENDKEYLLMYCEKNTIIKLCSESYQKILDFEKTINKKLTLFKCSNGYIQTHIPGEKTLYIHQIIMNCYGNGKGTKIISVDHIDQDPLNNSIENLRIATRKEQEQNSRGIKEGTQRERSSKKTLPDEISYDMLKKYVYYNREVYDKNTLKEREFFRVEHPKLDKPWNTTKSEKVSIQDKLNQANKVVDDLENDIYPEKTEPILPKYISLINARGKPHLVFEKRLDDKRLGLKMVLPENYDIHEQLTILQTKIQEKYDNKNIVI